MLILVSCITLAAPVASRADVVVDQNIVVERLKGPVTVVVTANPFRFPWIVKVNRTTLSAPFPDSQLFAALSVPSSPAPTSAPEIVIGGAAPTPSPQPGSGIEVTMLPNPGGVSAANDTCEAKRFDAIERCIRDLETQASFTKKYDIELAYESVCSAQLEFFALQTRTDALLATYRFDTEQNRRTSGLHILKLLEDSRGGGPQASCSKSDATQRAVFGYRSEAATVSSARAAIDRVKAFPSNAIVNETKLADALTTAVKAYDQKTVDKETTQDIVDRYCHDHPIVCKDAKKKAAEQKLAADKVSQSPLLGGSFRIGQAQSRLTALAAELKPFAADGDYPKAFGAAVSQLRYVRAVVLSNVGLSRFFVTVVERCRGLYGAENKTTITVQRSTNETNSILIDCPSKAFASVGFAFEAIPQQKLTAVAPNTGLPSPPPGSPAVTTSTIQDTNTADLRTIPVVMFSVRITDWERGDNGWYASFGIGLPSTTPSGAGIALTDFFLGGSYSLSRSLTATLGLAIGTKQEQVAGYRVSDPVGSAGDTPIRMRVKIAPFLAVTYGAH